MCNQLFLNYFSVFFGKLDVIVSDIPNAIPLTLLYFVQRTNNLSAITNMYTFFLKPKMNISYRHYKVIQYTRPYNH